LWISEDLSCCAYRATVDVPARFAKSKSVGAVFGLTSAKYQSSEIDRSGRISRCGDQMMRVACVNVACHAANLQRRVGHGIRGTGQAEQNGIGPLLGQRRRATMLFFDGVDGGSQTSMQPFMRFVIGVLSGVLGMLAGWAGLAALVVALAGPDRDGGIAMGALFTIGPFGGLIGLACCCSSR
jgi:hypothetical protein